MKLELLQGNMDKCISYGKIFASMDTLMETCGLKYNILSNNNFTFYFIIFASEKFFAKN
jgi:hypothetical protein